MGNRIWTITLMLGSVVMHVSACDTQHCTTCSLCPDASDMRSGVTRAAQSSSDDNQGKLMTTYLSQSGIYNTFLRALRVAGIANGDEGQLVRQLYKNASRDIQDKRSQGVTVFAPRDAAFKDMPKSLYRQLFGSSRILRDVMLYHVVPGVYTAEDLTSGVMKTLYGEHIALERQRNGDIVIDGHSRIVQPSIATQNGMIHTVDKVLLP